MLLVLLCLTGYSQNQSEIQLANEYLLKGDKRKAVEVYRDLAKDEINIPFIHNNYLNTLLDLNETAEAQAYLKRQLKRDPQNIFYNLDVGIVYVRTGDMTKADKHFKGLIDQYKDNVTMIKMLSDYLSTKSLGEYSIIALNESRKTLENPVLFSFELATLYRLKGQREKMIEEYLNFASQNSGTIQNAKNMMQILLTKPEELDALEKVLYDRIQKFPDADVYSDLLIWVTMQQKNFGASFNQARAYDRRYKRFGEKSLEIAKVALDNEDYETASKAYSYVIREYPGGPYYLQGQLGLLRTREARVKNTFPVNSDSVKSLAADYRKFVTKYPENANSLEAQRSEAMLYATYLDKKDQAIALLEDLIKNPKVSLQLKSRVKLDLGDIYLLKGEPWESTLLYSQVEKALEENPVGYEAKLKNAKLSYYKGDFKLAQEHLDILKEATTREIANDAMELSIRIKENLVEDTLGEALKAYAKVELLLYQNKREEALTALSQLASGTSATTDSSRTGAVSRISNSAIKDDVYWLEANIQMERGEFQKSIQLLQQIIDEYPDDILVDDAYFLQGEIYERHLSNKDKAMEIYRNFLDKYPGSVFAAEARKRFRVLRGDFKDTPVPQS
ncbi:MAG TPA: tetratricopeptide repeat protein [Cyclobacteriaceae bacterium]|nr:tetratricopeptide repeat protein [Cyclobacteriaceae bacterium]HMV07756.1 tetratricopeptide repeat protein [Cyclobacteriaceae bacterium]HMV88024.1 tetratricopeptide repeat protein [Cyclobacteriaceae bacterium]HMW98891.1 tetratricopeptide repeat protein [Cyclobacteriaceae bacterium]HMX48476.1 tetratricopeptide repeat protein [Cyclobacteriaceae bacterium]